MKYINADEINALILANTNGLLKAIDEMPSADVVEVVRCKDCKHFVETGGTRDGCFLFQGMTNPRNDDFCSEGERKEAE